MFHLNGDAPKLFGKAGRSILEKANVFALSSGSSVLFKTFPTK